MVKKKKDNPLSGLKRFNVDPNPITSAHHFSNYHLTSDIQRYSPDEDGEFDGNWSKEQYKESVEAQKGIMSGKRSVLDNNQPPIDKTGLHDILSKASVNGRPGGNSPERWLPEHFNYDYDYNYKVNDYADEAKKQGKAGRFQSWDAGYAEKRKKKPKDRENLEAAEPWRKTGDSSMEEGGPPEFNEWIKTQYDEASKGTPAPSVAKIFKPGYKARKDFKLSQSVADMGSDGESKTKYSTAIPHISQEQMAKDSLAHIKAVSPDDTKGIAETEATLSRIQKNGKVEQSALPQTSEKPVASKKKTEPTSTSAETKNPTAKKASDRTAKPAAKDKTKTASGRKFPDVNDKTKTTTSTSETTSASRVRTKTSAKESAKPAEAPAEKKNTGKYMVTYDPTGTTKLDKAEYVDTLDEARARSGKDKGRKERMADREANPAKPPEAYLKPESERTPAAGSTDPEFHDWSDEDAGISPSSPSSTSPTSEPSASPTSEPAKEKKPGLWSRIKGSLAGSEAKYESGPVVDDDGGIPKGGKAPKSEPKSEPVSEDGTGSWEPEPKATGGRGGHFAAGHGQAPTFGSQRYLGANLGGAGGATRDDGRTIQANQSYGSNIENGSVTGSKFGINDNTFGGSGPVVASTAGKATSDNPEATVLSTGGDAKQSHPRAQNASRGGRSTTKNSARTAKP
jgi:hypothetical protein